MHYISPCGNTGTFFIFYLLFQRFNFGNGKPGQVSDIGPQNTDFRKTRSRMSEGFLS